MENYVLYDEVGRGEHSIVYKGRKKGTIEFVAIHCVEKCKRLELRNIVRLTHEMDHPNVVRFHEWYETANHIWMVVELCTGDSLDAVLSQDRHLPEETVKSFATEIAKALFYIHSLGILYCDLKPSRIMLDGAGVLKLSDFALARVEGEEDFFDNLNDERNSDPEEEDLKYKDSEAGQIKRPKAAPHYMAPEVLAGGPHSREADLWSFGCVLYEMFTGEQPFTADSFPELVSKIFNDKVTRPVQRENPKEHVVNASQNFEDLMQSLLQKDPACRLDWEGLINHSFWQGDLESRLRVAEEKGKEMSTEDQLQTLIEDSIESSANKVTTAANDHLSEEKEKVVTNGGLLSAPKEMVRQGTYTFSSRPHTADSLSTNSGNKNLGSTHTVVRRTKSDGVANNANKVKGQDDKGSQATSVSKKTDNSLSTKQNQTLNNNKSLLGVKAKRVTPSEDLESKASTAVEEQLNVNTDGSKSISDLAIHQTDFEVTPIADNPKIKKFALPKWDSKALPCQPLKQGELVELSEDKLVEHFSAIGNLLSQSSKASSGPMASLHRSKLHTSLYLASLCRNGQIANAVFESDLVPVMLQQIKSGFSADFKGRLGYVLSLLAGNATEISEEFNMTEVFTVLTEVIRDNFRNAKLKQHLLPALGEFLFYAATQEESEGYEITQWEVPGVTYTIIMRCLHEGEDITVQHFAAKAIENVAATHGRHCSKFATNDAAQLLWNFFTHSSMDIQKVTAISALCRLTTHSPAVFQHVLEKAGFKAVIGAFSTAVPKIQQGLVTMFITVLATRPQVRRLIQERDLITKALHLFESPSMVIRAKVFLFVLTMVQANSEALLLCCQSRLVMYIERELKRSTPVKGESPENRAYLVHCQGLCVSAIVDATPGILSNVLAALDAVEGRRHPSAGQAKQLRIHLPLLSIILHLVTSHAFRAQIITREFLTDVGILLSRVNSIDTGSTSIGSAAGPNAAEDLTNVGLSIAEAITQHPPILLSHHALVTEHILPHLASLMSSSNGDTRVLCFRMFADVASLYFDDQNVYNSSSTADDVLASTKRLNEVISYHLLPQYHLILQDQDPLPAYGLKLLLSFLERSPDIIQIFMNQGLLVTMSQILQSHSDRLDRGMAQSMVGLLNCLLASEQVDMPLLYKQGLVDCLVSLFVDVASSHNEEPVTQSDAFAALLLPLLDSLNITLRFVSKEVRKALQAKTEAGPGKTAGQSQLAETLLVETKPLTDTTGLLVNFLCHEDTDVQDNACRCLYFMVELFGGILDDALSVDNMECFSEALKTSHVKKQKQLLRIIKRLLPSDSVVDGGQELVRVLQEIQSSSDSSTSEGSAVQSLAQEILTKLGVLK